MEMIIGTIGFAVTISAFKIGQGWGNILIITYLSIASMSSFFDNNVFFTIKDFESIGVKADSRVFNRLFIIQRFILDGIVANVIYLVFTIVFLLIQYGLTQVVSFIILVLFYYFISPAYCRIYENGNNYINYLYICIFCLIPIVLAIDYCTIKILFSLWAPNTFLDFCVYLIFCTLFYLVTSLISRNIRKKNSKACLPVAILSPLKRIDIWIYKDYLLNYRMILFNVLSIYFSAIIFIDFNFDNLKKMLILSIIACKNVFLNKKKHVGKPEIIAKDRLYFSDKLEMDRNFIIVKKFKTIFTGVVIKLFITLTLFSFIDNFSLIDLLIYCMTFICVAFTDSFRLLKNGLESKLIIYMINFSIPIIWGGNRYEKV